MAQKNYKTGKVVTYICSTCGASQKITFTGMPVKCVAEECTSSLFDKMVKCVLRFGPQIRLVLDMKQDADLDIEDMKSFCSEVFFLDIHEYQDRYTLEATLERLSKL